MDKIPIAGKPDDAIGYALKAIEGKWKLPVMYMLCGEQAMRYNELKKSLDITNMMLTRTLKELEEDGLVLRVQYNEVPLRVEYSATEKGRRLLPALREIRMWGEQLMNEKEAASVQETLAAAKIGGVPEKETGGIWRFQYEDGTYAAGTVITDPETGETVEVPRWEYISEAWWAFGADGSLKIGLVYDTLHQGWFYVDRKSGMSMGWTEIDGKWRYFDSVQHSATGRMALDTWIDGWYVDENGIWDGKDRRKRQEDRKTGEEEVDIVKVISDARILRKMTQKELAHRSGINQTDISRLENGTRNPTIAILRRLADGMDMKLKIEFVPKEKSGG